MRSQVKKGQKFERTFTSRFGKKITQKLTVVGVFGNSVLMDNGDKYHLVNFIK